MTTLVQKAVAHSRFNFNRRLGPGYVLLILWVLAMVGLPIARWLWGDDVIPGMVTLAAILQATAVFLLVVPQWGFNRTLAAFGVVALIGWGAEFIGHRTGFPFGPYVYTDALQPQLGGVPLLIPIAWWMLLPSSWTMAQLIVGERQRWWHHLAFVGVSALALTAWDLFLDPQMVAWGFWVWENPVGYFGIPWTNFAGWLLVSATITALVRPRPLDPQPLAFLYGVVWFLQSIGLGVFWGKVGPAVVGSLAMGAVMLLAYWRSRQRQMRSDTQ